MLPRLRKRSIRLPDACWSTASSAQMLPWMSERIPYRKFSELQSDPSSRGCATGCPRPCGTRDHVDQADAPFVTSQCRSRRPATTNITLGTSASRDSRCKLALVDVHKVALAIALTVLFTP